MSFDWKKYLDLANHLYNDNIQGIDREAAYRSATSRAYYAAFCFARNFSKNNLGFSPSYRSEDHWKLREFLRNNGKTNITRWLEQLHGWRKQCDYDDLVSNLTVISSNASRRANKIISNFP